MKRRDLSKVLLVSAAGTALLTDKARAQACATPCFPLTAAEQAAAVAIPTSAHYAYLPGDVRRYGDGFTAISHALNQAALTGGIRQVSLAPQGTYNIGDNTIYLPPSVSLRMNGASIVTTRQTAIVFGNGSALHGGDGSHITTSGQSGAALDKAGTDSNAFYIYGWPKLQAAATGVTGSRGLDFSRAYKGIFEIAVEGYETCISGGDGNPDHATYYNELRSPRITCSDATGGSIGIQLREGCNGTLISNPQINGGAVGGYGLYANAASSFTMVGGYIENFRDQSSTRGIYLHDVSNATVIGTTIETPTSATSNYAIGATGVCDNVTLIGCGFAGAWGASDKVMTWASSGRYVFLGGAPTNQVLHLGQSSFPASETSGTVRAGNVFASSIPLLDGVTAPATLPGRTFLFVDSSNGDLKVKFGNGTVRTLATDV